MSKPDAIQTSLAESRDQLALRRHPGLAWLGERVGGRIASTLDYVTRAYSPWYRNRMRHLNLAISIAEGREGWGLFIDPRFMRFCPGPGSCFYLIWCRNSTRIVKKHLTAALRELRDNTEADCRSFIDTMPSPNDFGQANDYCI